MSLQTFQYQLPCTYQGIEDTLPKEMAPFAFDLQRRLINNTTTLLNALTSQMIVDPSVVPTITSGQGSTTASSVITTSDLDATTIQTILWSN